MRAVVSFPAVWAEPRVGWTEREIHEVMTRRNKGTVMGEAVNTLSLGYLLLGVALLREEVG